MKKIVLPAIILALAALGAWFGWFRRAAEESGEEVKPVAKVVLVPLQRQTIVRQLDVFGVIVAAPSGEQVIVAPYDCLVRRIQVSTGAAVTAGERLLEIEPSPAAQLEFDMARSALALADQALAATRERYDLKLANRQELLAAQQAAEEARLKVASFSARGLGGSGQVTAAAPGIVSKFEAAVGTLVPAGTALVSVFRREGLEAKLGVEATEVAQIQPGQKVLLRPASRADTEPVESSVRQVGGMVDAASGTAEVRVAVPAGARLLLGEHVAAAIELQRAEGLVVPRSAVLPDSDRQVLFTVQDGRAVRHFVKIGLTAGDAVEISGENLQVGDAVVTLGNYELVDGMAVQTGEPDNRPEVTKP